MSIDNIVNITISQATSTVTTTTTNIPILLGASDPGWKDGDFVHSYGAASELLDDGFSETSTEFLAALALTEQRVIPNQFLVGRRQSGGEAGTPQVDTFQVRNVEPSHVYRFQYDNDTISYTSASGDTAQQILQALKLAFTSTAAAASKVTASVSNDGLTLTLSVKAPGVHHDISQIDTGLTYNSVSVAAPGTATGLTSDDLDALQQVNDSWYGLILLNDASDDDIKVAAKWVQPRHKRLFANSVSVELEDSTSTDNLAVYLKANGYDRTFVSRFIKGAATEGMSAWVGLNLPQTPGSNNWAFDTLVGQQPDTFSSNATTTMIGNPTAGTTGRNLNIYTTVGGQPITQMGTSIDGSYIDIGIGVDWLFFNLQSSVYGALVGGGKVPMTDAGVAILKAAVRNVLDQGVANGLIDGTQAISVTAAKVASLPKSQRAARRAPTINFSCVLQGAVNAVTIAGTVSV